MGSIIDGEYLEMVLKIKKESNCPVVSVLCATFNQREYIERCLISIVNQRTTFPFEVIVHDDCSTDGTKEFVENFASEYPEIIVPIFEDENQHNKGKSPTQDIMLPLARGKYIAICEGDDYWIDRDKLQIQFDYLETHPECLMCLHNAVVCDYTTGVDYYSQPMCGDVDKSAEQIIEEGGGLLNPTASFFLRKEYYVRPPRPLMVLDHFWLINCAIESPVHWIEKPMSVYRYGSNSSFTSRNWGWGEEKARSFHSRYIKSLEYYDEKSNRKYYDAFERRINIQKHAMERDINQARALKAIQENDFSLAREISRGLLVKTWMKCKVPLNVWNAIRRFKVILEVKKTKRLCSLKNGEYDFVKPSN